MEGYLTRQQAQDWFIDERNNVVEKLKEQGGGKIKVKCPLCEALGDFLVIPIGNSRIKVSYFCAECGFLVDDDGLKYFPPPPPPKHLRKIRH